MYIIAERKESYDVITFIFTIGRLLAWLLICMYIKYVVAIFF